MSLLLRRQGQAKIAHELQIPQYGRDVLVTSDQPALPPTWEACGDHGMVFAQPPVERPWVQQETLGTRFGDYRW